MANSDPRPASPGPNFSQDAKTEPAPRPQCSSFNVHFGDDPRQYADAAAVIARLADAACTIADDAIFSTSGQTDSQRLGVIFGITECVHIISAALRDQLDAVAKGAGS